MTHSTAHCAMHSFFDKHMSSITKHPPLKNGIVGFPALRYLYHEHIFDIFIWFFACKTVLKTAKTVRTSAKLEHQKPQIKIWKIMLCDTLIQRKKPYAIFPENIFHRWQSTLLSMKCQIWNLHLMFQSWGKENFHNCNYMHREEWQHIFGLDISRA